MSYAAAASGNSTCNFVYNKSVPLDNRTMTISSSPKWIQLPPSRFRSAQAMQATFDTKDTALDPLNTSAELDSYWITSVNTNNVTYHHQLTYFEVCALASNTFNSATYWKYTSVLIN
jgi:hypothetical protein